MTLASLILLTLKVSIMLSVFAIGLRATHKDAGYLLQNPGKLARSMISMNVVMPVCAVLMSLLFDLHPAVKIALVGLSVSPLPPVLPKKAFKAGGRGSYTIGLLVAASLLAIVFVPLALELFERIFSVPLQLSPRAVAMLVVMTVLAPLFAGIVVNRLAAGFAEKIAKPVELIATVILLASALPILFTAFSTITSLIGNGTIAALAAFVAIGLASGHLLGGPEEEDRPVLALSTASRHPGVAIAIAQTNFPEQKLAIAAVLLYLVVGGILAIPYLKWTKRKPEPARDETVASDVQA